MHDGRQFLFSNMKDRIWNQPKRGKQSLFLTSEPRNEYSESFAAPKLSRESYNSETNLSKATLQFHYRSLHHLLMKGQPVDGQQRILSQTQRHFFLGGRIAILGPLKIANRGSKVASFLTDIGLLELQEGKTRVKDWICETNKIQCLSLTLHSTWIKGFASEANSR